MSTCSPDSVFTLLRVPMTDAWGTYDPDARIMLLSDTVPANRIRAVVRGLLRNEIPERQEAAQ